MVVDGDEWQAKNHGNNKPQNNPNDNTVSHYLDDEKPHLPTLQLEQNNNGSIPENATLANFETGSQRDIAMGTIIDQPPPTSETKKQRVQFRDDLAAVHEVERVDTEDEGNYWMSADDYDRIATELKISGFCRDNTQEKGTLTIAEARTSVDQEIRRRGLAQCKHHWSVMKEIERQKATYGKVTDWDQVRKTSEQLSAACKRRATETGRRDEESMRRIRSEINDSEVVAPATKDTTKEQMNEHTDKKKVFFSRQTKPDEVTHRWTKGKITDEAGGVTCIPGNDKTKMKKKKFALFAWFKK